jgi:hypothetical protein
LCYDDELATYLGKQGLKVLANNMDEEEEQWARYDEALLGVNLGEDANAITDAAIV